eukprot:7972299-Pyramimonas_sp.AAC.1
MAAFRSDVAKTFIATSYRSLVPNLSCGTSRTGGIRDGLGGPKLGEKTPGAKLTQNAQISGCS